LEFNNAVGGDPRAFGVIMYSRSLTSATLLSEVGEPSPRIKTPLAKAPARLLTVLATPRPLSPTPESSPWAGSKAIR
jgi:hypothetical protein